MRPNCWFSAAGSNEASNRNEIGIARTGARWRDLPDEFAFLAVGEAM
jgi:hypothetical protein